MSDIKEQLKQNLDVAEWDWLVPHAQRDTVIVVSSKLDLLDVGEAIATDNTTFVQNWIVEELLSKPSPEQLGNWNRDRTKRFNALIVEPYVLVQEKVGF